MAYGHHAAWPSPSSGHLLPHVIIAVALPHVAWPSTRCTPITQQQLNSCVQSALSELKLEHGKGAVLTQVKNHFMHFDTLTKYSPVNSENYSYSPLFRQECKNRFQEWQKKNLQLISITCSFPRGMYRVAIRDSIQNLTISLWHTPLCF